MRYVRASIFLIALIMAAGIALAAMTFPALTGRVVDNANLLSPGSEAGLTRQLVAHEAATGEQIVVVTLPDIGGQPIEEFGYQLGRHWGIGQKGKDNGALLIVVPSDRSVRIEAGYGLEDRLTDAASSRIIGGIIIPAFRAGKFEQGIEEGTGAILSVLGGNDAPARPSNSNTREVSPHSVNWLLILVLVYFIFFRRRRNSSLLGSMILGGVLGGGRRSGGFGGGGFRGGGGGFGGGGASGRW